MISRFSTMFCAVAATVVAALPAAAQDTVRIAYVDPLSGGGASIGESGRGKRNAEGRNGQRSSKKQHPRHRHFP